MPSKSRFKFPCGLNPVYVEWIDSMGTGGWSHNFKSDDSMTCYSIGHMIKKTKDRVVLSLNKNTQQTGEHMEIPLVAIKRIRRLKI